MYRPCEPADNVLAEAEHNGLCECCGYEVEREGMHVCRWCWRMNNEPDEQ